MTDRQSTAPGAYLATCPKGLEALLSDELTALGAEPTKTTVAGVFFQAPCRCLSRLPVVAAGQPRGTLSGPRGGRGDA